MTHPWTHDTDIIYFAQQLTDKHLMIDSTMYIKTGEPDSKAPNKRH